MWLHVIRHVANMWAYEQAMHLSCAGSFFDIFPFSRRRLCYFVPSALDLGEFKRLDGGIFRNLMELSMFTLFVLKRTRLWSALAFRMLTVGKAIFWLHYLIISSRDRHVDSSVLIQLNIVWNRWKRTMKARSIRVSLNQGTANYVNTVYFILHGNMISELVERSLFTLTINQYTIANVCLHLCFQFRIM